MGVRVQRSRVDVLPLTWEVPTMIAVSWLCLSSLSLPCGQGIAFWLTGDGFVWPRGQLLTSLIGLLHGDVGRGLTPALQGAMPSDVLVYGAAAVSEIAVCVVVAWVMAWWWRSMGPGAQFGIATSHQVQTVLGAGNLRRRRRVIRPDLYPDKTRHQSGRQS